MILLRSPYLLNGKRFSSRVFASLLRLLVQQQLIPSAGHRVQGTPFSNLFRVNLFNAGILHTSAHDYARSPAKETPLSETASKKRVDSKFTQITTGWVKTQGGPKGFDTVIFT